MRRRQAKKIAWYINDEFTWAFYDKCKKKGKLCVFHSTIGWYTHLFKHYRMKTLVGVAKKYKGGDILTTMRDFFGYKQNV